MCPGAEGSGQRDGKCKYPEGGMCLACSRNSKEVEGKQPGE